jgi:hypothetical protein
MPEDGERSHRGSRRVTTTSDPRAMREQQAQAVLGSVTP